MKTMRTIIDKKNRVRLLAALLLLSGCGTPDKREVLESQSTKQTSEELTEVKDSTLIDPHKLESIVKSIPSPVEITTLIEASGSDYNAGYLNDYEKRGQYDSQYKKALNLGVYGADLAYSNVYESSERLNYLLAVSDLADDLGIGQYFDLSALKELITSGGDLSFMLEESNENFEKIDKQLRIQGTPELSILLLAGGWIEGVNLMVQVYRENEDNTELKEKIGEQKVVLNRLVELTSMFQSNDKISKIHQELSKLEDSFDNVEIENIEGEATVEVVDGVLEVVSSSYSVVIISEQTMKNITDGLSRVRQEIIK